MASEAEYEARYAAEQDAKYASRYAAEKAAQEKETAEPTSSSMVGDFAAGALRGAGSIGATILAPWDIAQDALAGKGLSLEANRQRRASMDSALQEMGADPTSTAYGVGKFGAEVAGTMGVGGAIANTIRTLAPQATRLAPAVEAWGMTAPRVPGSSRLVDAGYRAAGGAIPGAAAAGMIDPEHATTGAVIGAAVPFAAPVAGWFANAAVDKGLQLTGGAQGQAITYLRKVFPDNWQEVAARMKDLRGFLPGESPTAGMGAVSGDTPIAALKALQTGAEQRLPQPFVEMRRANEAARTAPLEEMAHVGRRYPGEAMSEAETLRAQVTDPLYQRASGDRIPLDERVAAILRGEEVAPSVSRGDASFQQAQQNAIAAGRAVPAGEVAAPRGGEQVSPLMDQLGMLSQKPFVPDFGSRSINDLQRVKNNLTKQINDLSAATDSSGKLKLAQLVDARNQLTTVMRQSGNYAVASDIFKNYSAAQNRAQVSDVLLDALRSPAGLERKSAFLTARENAPQTIKKSGGARLKNLEDVYTPNQMRETINPLTRSVEREADYSALNAPQQSLPEMGGVLTAIEHASVPIFSPIITALRGVTRKLGASTDVEAQLIIDNAMTDPRVFAKLIEGTPPNERSKVMNALRRMAASNQSAAAIGASAQEMQ